MHDIVRLIAGDCLGEDLTDGADTFDHLFFTAKYDYAGSTSPFSDSSSLHSLHVHATVREGHARPRWATTRTRYVCIGLSLHAFYLFSITFQVSGRQIEKLLVQSSFSAECTPRYHSALYKPMSSTLSGEFREIASPFIRNAKELPSLVNFYAPTLY